MSSDKQIHGVVILRYRKHNTAHSPISVPNGHRSAQRRASQASQRANLEWGDKDSLTGGWEELFLAKTALVLTDRSVGSLQKACERGLSVSDKQCGPAQSEGNSFRYQPFQGINHGILLFNGWWKSKAYLWGKSVKSNIKIWSRSLQPATSPIINSPN